MPSFRFATVDVFTTERFGGNPLAVFPDAAGISDADMQKLARELNLSETTFVLPPADPANTARVRIFTPVRELPFAGHPNVGTGWLLAQEGRAPGGVLHFEELAGLVEVKVAGGIVTIAAPRPLSLGAALEVEHVAACAGLAPEDVVATHLPALASTGNPFVFAEVTPAALSRAAPDLAAFRRVAALRADLAADLSLHLHAHDGGRLRTRMFGPLLGVAEDPATGSAAVTLGALLLSRSGAARARYAMVQGVEMGRPSLLQVEAWRAADGIRATVGGAAVPVLRGEVTL